MESGKCFFLFVLNSFFLSFLCVLSGENFPEFLQNDNRQRHSEQKASLRHKKRYERISPAEFFADCIIARQIIKKFEKAFRLFKKIFEKP